MNVQYCLVIGCPRSGTTFLMKALKALPNSECISGIIFPVPIPHIVNDYLPPHIYNALAFSLQDSLKVYLDSGRPNSQFMAFHKWLTGCISIQELWQALQRKRTVELMVYKENFLSFAPEFTYQSLPNCKIIHIYRDGRDCADSLVRCYDILSDEKLSHLCTSEMPIGRKYDHRYVPWWVEEGLEEEFLASTPYVRAIWMWKEMVNRCHDFFSRPEIMASGRVMLLKYEDFVANPLKYGELVVEHFGSSMNNLLQRKFKQASTRSIGIHKQRDSNEISAAERIAKRELALYGYL